MEKTILKVITGPNGEVLSAKAEVCEWNPTKFIRPSGSPSSRSTEALKNIKVGETLRIVHPDLLCKLRTYHSKGKDLTSRACSLQLTVTSLRKQGWELEQYHETDHIMVVRRLK